MAIVYLSLGSNMGDRMANLKVALNLLENKGLKNRELTSLNSWEKLSQEEKEARKQELLKNSQFARLKSKGYAITRIAKEEGDFTATKSLGSPENANLNAFSNQKTQEKPKETNNG